MLKHFTILSISCVVCLGVVLFGVRRLYSRTPELTWHVIDGRWAENGGITSVLTYGRGDMEIGGRESWTNYSFSGDLRYDLLFPETHYGDAGLVVRVSDASEGVDSYRGYYAGLRADDQRLVFGRADYGWHELATARLASPVKPGVWYHMNITAHGCSFVITVTGSDLNTTNLPFTDSHCKTNGGVGLRSFYAQSSWRNVAIHLD